jgi:hypothetical protein
LENLIQKLSELQKNKTKVSFTKPGGVVIDGVIEEVHDGFVILKGRQYEEKEDYYYLIPFQALALKITNKK